MDVNESQPRENKYFHALVMNLQVAALHHLGMLSGNDDSDTEVNIDAARDTIEMLRMIYEKTRGNLTKGEDNVLDQVLYQVQMAFVEKSKEKAPTHDSNGDEQERKTDSGETE